MKDRAEYQRRRKRSEKVKKEARKEGRKQDVGKLKGEKVRGKNNK